MNKYKVIVDTRERAEYRWWFDPDDCCEGSELLKLDTGDYSIKGMEHLLSIDRKRNTAEISQNIVDSRFFDELERMQVFKYKAIVCEFNMFAIMNFPYSSGIPNNKLKNIKITSKLILSKIAYIQAQYNIPFIFCDNREYAMIYSQAFFKKVYAIECQNV
jgi:ERCC4-type nuclease